VWRLVFTVFTITFGFGIVVYLLLWIFVPEE
jgi:phage shock protein C